MSKKVLFRILAVVGVLAVIGACVAFAIIPGINALATRAKAEVKPAPTAEVVAKVEVPAVEQPAEKVAEPTKAPDPTAAPAVAKVEPTVAPTEKPKTAEDASQIGSGEDTMPAWTDPAAKELIVGNNAEYPSAVRSAMVQEKAQPNGVEVVYISSDPVTKFELLDNTGKVVNTWPAVKKGFIAIVVKPAGYTIHMEGVGWNPENENWNTWNEVYAVPDGVKADDVANALYEKYKGKDGKPVEFIMYENSTEPTIKK